MALFRECSHMQRERGGRGEGECGPGYLGQLGDIRGERERGRGLEFRRGSGLQQSATALFAVSAHVPPVSCLPSSLLQLDLAFQGLRKVYHEQL